MKIYRVIDYDVPRPLFLIMDFIFFTPTFGLLIHWKAKELDDLSEVKFKKLFSKLDTIKNKTEYEITNVIFRKNKSEISQMTNELNKWKEEPHDADWLELESLSEVDLANAVDKKDIIKGIMST